MLNTHVGIRKLATKIKHKKFKKQFSHIRLCIRIMSHQTDLIRSINQQQKKTQCCLCFRLQTRVKAPFKPAQGNNSYTMCGDFSIYQIRTASTLQANHFDSSMKGNV